MRLFLSLFAVLLLSASRAQEVEPIKGTWITNVASDALLSKKNIRKAVANCKKNGLNSIFLFSHPRRNILVVGTPCGSALALYHIYHWYLLRTYTVM